MTATPTYGELTNQGASTNIAWHHASVDRAARAERRGHRSAILWFTGLSGSGKSTLANAVNQALALGMLEAYEVSVECAENGQEALDKLAASNFDLVLMDCQMPGIDGFEATRRWRAEEATRGAARVPIVALTANAMPGDREACLASGMDDYLAKPFTRANLTEVLRLWLGSTPLPLPSITSAAPG